MNEKDITLSIVNKAYALLQNTDKVKVYLTRNDDSRPENRHRANTANDIDKLSEFLDVDKAYLLGLQKEEKIISLANFIMELGNERFTKFFNELRTNFSEQDYDNLTNIVSAYSLLDNEDRIFFTKSMALKSGLIDRTFKAENGKIVFIDNDKPSS